MLTAPGPRRGGISALRDILLCSEIVATPRVVLEPVVFLSSGRSGLSYDCLVVMTNILVTHSNEAGRPPK